MSLVLFFGGLILGFVLGVGASLFYLRWKMKRQLGSMQQQMDAMMDLTDEMDDMMSPEDVDEDIEDDS